MNQCLVMVNKLLWTSMKSMILPSPGQSSCEPCPAGSFSSQSASASWHLAGGGWITIKKLGQNGRFHLGTMRISPWDFMGISNIFFEKSTAICRSDFPVTAGDRRHKSWVYFSRENSGWSASFKDFPFDFRCFESLNAIFHDLQCASCRY